MRVDLSDPAPGGAQDENDVLTGVESVAGGDGDDILIGDGEDNYLSGGPGRDVVEAGAGDDLVVEAEKADLGGGNDRLGSFVPATGVRASDVACGAGRDALSLASFVRLEAPADCEYAWFPGSPPLQVRFVARLARQGMAVKVRDFGGTGELVVRARRSGRLVEVGRARFAGIGTFDTPQTRSVVVRLNATGRRLAARSAGAVFDVTLRRLENPRILGRMLVSVTAE